jgi:peptidoglycan hydrolase-like protein with peptidoglycan-binding domain
MRRLAWYLKRAFPLAGILALACSCAFAETAPSSTKSTPKPVTKSKPKTATSKAKSNSAHSRTTASKTTSRKGKRSKKVKGQQKIDSDRTHQIQEALIRQHYLSGEPTGKWDASTEDALRRFQADNGWQNKTVPDSRALIKLGLGPSHDHLLNPESAMTTGADVPHSTTTPSSLPASTGPSPSGNQPQR